MKKITVTVTRNYCEPILVEVDDGFFDTMSPNKILILHWKYRWTPYYIKNNTFFIRIEPLSLIPY